VRKFLAIGLMVLVLGLLLSACMNPAAGGGNVTSIRDAISAASSSTVNATVVGVVTYGYGNYVLIQDNTAAIEVYGSGMGSAYTVGDKLRAFGSVKKYNGNWEIAPASTSDVEKIGTGSVQPTEIPTNTALSDDYDWMLVKVSNLPVKTVADKYSNVVLANGSKDITIYSYDNDVRNWLSSLATGDKVSVQGYVKYMYGEYKIILRDSNDELK
jgi:DNA/RNA endonuclease YhcR with UshA esterase domain